MRPSSAAGREQAAAPRADARTAGACTQGEPQWPRTHPSSAAGFAAGSAHWASAAQGTWGRCRCRGWGAQACLHKKCAVRGGAGQVCERTGIACGSVHRQTHTIEHRGRQRPRAAGRRPAGAASGRQHGAWHAKQGRIPTICHVAQPQAAHPLAAEKELQRANTSPNAKLHAVPGAPLAAVAAPSGMTRGGSAGPNAAMRDAAVRLRPAGEGYGRQQGEGCGNGA